MKTFKKSDKYNEDSNEVAFKAIKYHFGYAQVISNESDMIVKTANSKLFVSIEKMEGAEYRIETISALGKINFYAKSI